MITEELRKYIKMVKEEEIVHSETDSMLHEMANIHSHRTGIPDVVIWVGTASKKHGLRVKVSNLKNRYRQEDSFVIQMPNLDYDPDQVASWITSDTMNKILSWIKINQKVLFDYENGKIDDTDVFLNMLSKV